MCCGIVFTYSDGALLNITLNVKSSKGISFASTFLPQSAIFSEICFLAFTKSSIVFTSDNTSNKSKNNFLMNPGVCDFLPVKPLTSTFPESVTPK